MRNTISKLCCAAMLLGIPMTIVGCGGGSDPKIIAPGPNDTRSEQDQKSYEDAMKESYGKQPGN